MKEVINRRSNGKDRVFKKRYFVYMLTNKETNEIIYIGHTSNEYDRFRSHFKNDSERKRTKIQIYLSCIDKSLIVYKNIKEFDNIISARSMERKLIAYYKPLCNVQGNPNYLN